jgi:hypothetical protein
MSRGLRTLTVEAGWTRAPGDGFMRLGAMAVARLVHYGLRDKNVVLALIQHDGIHSWFEIKNDKIADPFVPEDVEKHVEVLLTDSVR